MVVGLLYNKVIVCLKNEILLHTVVITHTNQRALDQYLPVQNPK